ncbi:MAG: hypothetical protein VX100_07465 [Pseudomonadota bacterium]|nr:hypothetical protein [Pseudomonadota bacterium]
MSNELVLSLVLDADNKLLVKSVRDGAKEVDRFSGSVKKAGKETDTMSGYVRDANGRLRDANGRFVKAGKSAGEFGEQVSTTNHSLVDMRGLLATLGIGVAAREMYTGIDAMQGYRAQLKTITGDMPAATAELKRLVDFAKTTPYTLEQSVEGFSKLTNLGLEPSERALRSYGNTAAAMGKDLMMMVEAVSDAAVGEFERLKEFGIKASQQGENVSFTFKGVTKTVKKDAKSIQEYLLNIGETDFAGAMSDQMDRLSAKSSNLGISFQLLWDKAGDLGAADAIGGVLDGMASGVDYLTANLPSLVNELELLGVIVGTGTALYLAPLIFQKMAAKALMARAAIGALNTTTSTLNKSFAILGAAVTGWQIGSYLHDEFAIAKKAGLAFVAGMEKGFAKLEYAFKAYTTIVKHNWTTVINALKLGYSGFLDVLSSGAKFIGLDSISQKLSAWETQTANSITKQSDLKASLVLLNSQYQTNLKTIDETIFSLWQKVDADENNKNKIEESSNAITENNALVENANALTDNAIDLNEEYIAQLEQELLINGKSAKEKAVLLNLAKLDKNATKSQIKEVKRLTEALFDQKQAQKSLSTDDLVKQAENFGDAWSQAGNAIVDAFGSVADQLERLSKNEEDYLTLSTNLANQKKAVEKDLTLSVSERERQINSLSAAEEDLAYNRLQANMNSYAGMARAAGQFFDEQSSAREKLHKIETAFAIVETALALKKAAANALTAITNQGSGDPYSAFGRIAAMAALMAGLGVFSGSASGNAPASSEQRQKTQGTGTVLGDAEAKSESILNSLERTEELELDQYVELRAMNVSLNQLNANIVRMAASLIGSFGRFDESNYSGELGKTSTTSKYEALFIGMGKTKSGSGLLDKIISSFSTTRKALVDSGVTFFAQTLGDIIETGLVDAATYAEIKTTKKKFWGLKKRESYSTEYTDLDAQLSAEFALIFESLGESLTAALDVLGLEAANALESFVIDIPHLSLKDLKGDEIEAELQAVFSAQADLMAKHLVPAIGQFQKVGEGLYDTLIRVAQEQAVFNRVLDYTNQSLGGLTGLDMIGASQNIIELAGGIEALADAAQTYYNEFLTESEQFAFVSEQITEQLAALGLTLPTSREGFKELIGSIDLTTESGQALYAALSQLFGQLDEYYDSVEQQAEAETELAAQRKEFNEDIRRQLMQLNEYELAALDLSDWYENARKQAEEVGADTALLEQLYAQKRMALAEEYINAATEKAAQAREAANDAFAEAVDAEVSLYKERIDAINEFSLALSASIAEIRIAMGELTNVDYLSGLENNARENYQSTAASGTIEDQLSTLDELQAAILNRFNAEIAGYDELINTAKSNIDALKAEQQTLTDTFEKAVSNAQRDFDKLAATINKTASSIDAAIYKIESSLPGFDAIGYSNQTINGLYGSLTGEATAEELARINELNSAIAARYQQELNAISANQSAQEKSYSEQLASFNALNNAAKQLKQAADALLISDLSSLTNAAQVDEAKNQFNTLAARARSGDADAMAQLQSVGTRYLELSRSYNPANYDSIFDSVHSVFEELGAGRNIGPAPHPRITAFENKKISLANSTVAELKELKALTEELEQQAKKELAANIAELTNAYKEDSNAIADAIANQELELTELEAAKLLLQQTTVEELEAIKLLLEDLGLEAVEDRDSAIAELEAKLSADLAEINDTLEQELAEIRAVFAEETAAILDVNQAQVIAIEDVKNAIIDTAPPEIQPIDVPWPEPIIKLPQMQQNQIDELKAIRAEIARTNQQQQHALNEAQRQAKQAREDAARSRAELSNMRKEMQKQRAEQVRANNAIEDLAKESNA